MTQRRIDMIDINNDLEQLMDLLDRHQKKAMITCEETCWCWDIEQAILKIESGKDKEGKEN